MAVVLTVVLLVLLLHAHCEVRSALGLPTFGKETEHRSAVSFGRLRRPLTSAQPDALLNSASRDISSTIPGHNSTLRRLLASVNRLRYPGLAPIHGSFVLASQDHGREFSQMSSPVRQREGWTEQVVIGAKSTFEISFNSEFPQEAQGALSRAAKSWADVFPVDVPLRVRVFWEALPGSALAGTPLGIHVRGTEDASLRDDDMYIAALASSLTGRDFLPKSIPHVEIIFNSKAFVDWHFGESDVPLSRMDFETLALHELGHGLFFVGNVFESSLQGIANFLHRNNVPSRLDRFLVNGESEGLAACMGPGRIFQSTTSDSLRFRDPDDTDVSFGMYAPGEFIRGSSVYHLDGDTLRDDCERLGLDRLNSTECSATMTARQAIGDQQREVGMNTLRILNTIRGSGSGYSSPSCEL